MEESITATDHISVHTVPTTKIHKNAIKAWMLSASLYGLVWLIPSFFYAALAVGEGLEGSLAWYEAIDWTLFATLTFLELVIYLLGIFL
ncbi:MAG: hypothetical protein WD597_05445, partial [Balneolaceae bacterium]